MQNRPKPEDLLIRAEEEAKRKYIGGRLKIYLGAAPGVGKTYTMLKDALMQRSQGLDVVIGVVESHGRQKIEAMMKDLEILPLQTVDYHGKTFKEFDLDASLKRQPALILMDEIAHTNVPGLRHSKRWQDIKEILDRGIDVYTTLNVQHIESLNDVIQQIVGIPIRETIPDSMLEMADTIEIVDLPPEELIKRLEQGEVYFPQQAEIAAHEFFRIGNLNALRELALRVTAERVEAQVLLYRRGQHIERIWPTQEILLVGVGPEMNSEKVIRSARRMASQLKTQWIAVHVEAPSQNLTTEQRNQAIQNLRLAEQLGAETHILTSNDVAQEIIRFAHDRNVTKIILGKKNRPWWKEWFRASVVDTLIRQPGDVDIEVVKISQRSAPAELGIFNITMGNWKKYGFALVISIVATLINLSLLTSINSATIGIIYIVAIMIVAFSGELFVTGVASFISFLAYDYFFIPPLNSLEMEDPQYFFTGLVFLLIGQVLAYLIKMAQRQNEITQQVLHRTTAIHGLSRALTRTRGLQNILETSARYLSEIFESEVLILIPDEGHLTIKARYKTNEDLAEKEKGVAQWVYDLGQPAGKGTNTLPLSDAIFVPMLATKGPAGVVRVKPFHPQQLFTPQQMHLLEACANQTGVALEVDYIQDQFKKIELQKEKERVGNLLLQTVSHDLRSPIRDVISLSKSLVENNESKDPLITEIADKIYYESERLHRIISNVLQMAYLETENVPLRKGYHSLETVIVSVLKTLAKTLGDRQLLLMSQDIPQLYFDKVLIEEVFINLIDNADKFTPNNNPIEIFTKIEDHRVQITVADRGIGLLPEEINQLFEKFYRGQILSTERGLGLGLAICKNIIEAHGGKIWAEEREGGGALFCFTLPI